MKNTFTIWGWFIFAGICCLTAGCANRGIGPQGGPKDTMPPVVIKQSPANGTLKYEGKTIDLVFNEYIQLDDVSNNVLISPPQQHPAEIKANGKKLHVEFVEDLIDNTTYTIDFGNAICDNNEKNPYKNYTFSFSTGDQIDSLEIYGTMINAEDLNPISGILVGIQQIMEDSAFESIPFTRIGKTDENGDFSIKNISKGTYRIYGLQDVSRDYVYQPGEGLAFTAETYTPYIHIETERDTIFVLDTISSDSTMVADSVITREYYYFEPSNILLSFFKENKQKQYFLRALREKQHLFTLLFSSPQTEMPNIKAMRLERDSLLEDSTWVDFTKHSICRANATLDTITYWLTDSAAIKMDSIRFEMRYFITDSLYNLVQKIDTVYAVYKAPRMTDKVKENLRKKELTEPLKLNTNAKSSFEVYDTLSITSQTPIYSMDAKHVHMQLKIDTTWKNVPCSVVACDDAQTKYYVISDLKQDTEYRLVLDSAAFIDIYGKANLKREDKITLRSIDEYSSLTIRLKDINPQAIVQLLDDKDMPVRWQKAEFGSVEFKYLLPKTYYVRMFIDLNNDGKWTTGDWTSKRQPEPVYYMHKKMNLRANWDFEETFDWKGIPLLNQKPAALIKDAGNKKK